MNLLEADLKYIWHPAQQMKDAEVFPPVVIDHGKGCYLYDTNGKEYIDIISPGGAISWAMPMRKSTTPLKTNSTSWNTSYLPTFPIARPSNCAKHSSRCCPRA